MPLHVSVSGQLNENTVKLLQTAQANYLYLRVSFHLSSEHSVMEELLQSLILIIVAQVFKQCSLRLAD